MNGKQNRWSIMPTGIRRKITAAFCLMSIIPLLVAAFITSTHVFPVTTTFLDLFSQSGLLVATLLIALMGFYITKGIVDPIIRMAFDARSIASGDSDKVIEVQSEDEVGDLGMAVNEMADRIKQNMTELNTYSERVEQINHDINKKVTALSSVLQITTLMSRPVQLDIVLNLVMDKVNHVTGCTHAILFLRKPDDHLYPHLWRGNDINTGLKLDSTAYAQLLEQMERKRELVVCDAIQKKNFLADKLLRAYGLAGGVLVPIVYQGKLFGLLFVASNRTDSIFPVSDLEIIRIFQKQIGIALENDFLVKRTKELSVRDESTGLFNKRFIRERLSEEIRRAILFQRPCSYALLSIDGFGEYEKQNTPNARRELLKSIARVITKSLDDISKAGHVSDDSFAIIFPEKNKGEALQHAQLIQNEIARMNIPRRYGHSDKNITLSIGISANPLDGLTSDELVNKAMVSLLEARRSGRDRDSS